MSEITRQTITGYADSNPFVGPRPILLGEALHGRSTEVDELCDRIEARRIVVLHSPSGAGKSSLVHAGLTPRLERERYDVWKPVRLNLDPRRLEGVPEDTNRYLLSAKISLEEELPPEHRRSPAQLATIDFLEYLKTRPRRKGKEEQSAVLLFDQFEEVLTVDSRAVEAKREFFIEVGRALDDERYWALFIIREDYLAALAPYRDRIPTQLANTFRLDLLGLAGAREAAEQLALSGRRSFPAVDQLIRDVSRVQVQQPDGSFVFEQGQNVEPVQLQVVCRRLWAAMPKDATSIEPEDIEAYGDVSTSLAGYYADAVRTIAESDTALERSIRDWVGHELIAGGHRSQVRQDSGSTAKLAAHVIEKVLDTYLVRSEQRAGANWFELSHDRLVEPILKDNTVWEQDHLHPLQVQAKLWEDGGRARAMLLGAGALPGAVKWATENSVLLTEGEREFLELSQTLRAEEMRQRRRQRGFMAALAIVAIMAMVLGGIAWFAQGRAEEQKEVAEEQKEVAEEQKEVAEEQKEVAEAAKITADDAKTKAERAQTKAEQAQKTNERLVRELLRQMFQVALRRFIETLAQGGAQSGEIVVDDSWTPLLERNGQRFAAATVIEGGGRIVAAGHDAVLREVDKGGRSLFLEITVEWLLGDQGRRGVAIITQQSQRNKRLEALRRNLSALRYKDEVDPPLAVIADHLDVGMIIIDNRWTSLTVEEIAAVEGFVRGGGGLLVVGGGREWLRHEVGEGVPAPTLENYPMNRLMSPFGVRWPDATIDPEQLEKPEDDTTVHFVNETDHAVNLLLKNSEGREEYYTTLERYDVRPLRTALGRTWAIRTANGEHIIGEATIRWRKQIVTVNDAVSSRRAMPRVKLQPKPEPKLAQLPKTLSKADMDLVLAGATQISRVCGRNHGAFARDVDVSFVVTPGGRVESASANKPLKGTPVGTCVAQEIAKQRFPESLQGMKVRWRLPLR